MTWCKKLLPSPTKKYKFQLILFATHFSCAQTEAFSIFKKWGHKNDSCRDSQFFFHRRFSFTPFLFFNWRIDISPIRPNRLISQKVNFINRTAWAYTWKIFFSYLPAKLCLTPWKKIFSPREKNIQTSVITKCEIIPSTMLSVYPVRAVNAEPYFLSFCLYLSQDFEAVNVKM